MNELRSYLELKGMSVRKLAEDIGFEYTGVLKTIIPTRYRLKDGTVRYRQSEPIRIAIAEYLGFSREELWGPGAQRLLRKLIRQEIERIVSEHQAQCLVAGRQLRERLLAKHLPRKAARIADKTPEDNVNAKRGD